MSIIYRKDDLIKVDFGDIVFGIKPLSYMERVEIVSCISNDGGSFIENAAKGTYAAMKYGIRSIEGVKTPDGNDYKLTFDEFGNLSEDSIDDILNLDICENMGKVLQNFAKGVPSKLIDPSTGKEIEGVKVINKVGVPKK